MRRFVIIAATWGGSGFSPVASGTAGTLAAIPFYLILCRLSLPLYILTTVAFIFFSFWISGLAENIFNEHDSGKIVIDEVAGYLVTMTAVAPSWQAVVAGFLLFRFFDITKIPPARQLDQGLKNGYGVVLDDVMAGVYSCLCLHAVMALL